MMGLCHCGEDLALGELFAETVLEEETMVVSQSQVNSLKKKNISDYFGKSSTGGGMNNQVIYYETRTVAKEIQDDSWMYDDLHLFRTYDCKTGALADVVEEAEEENDVIETVCEQRAVSDIERKEDSTQALREKPAATASKSSIASRLTRKKKKIKEEDRNEILIVEAIDPEDPTFSKNNKQKKKKKKFFQVGDRNEAPYMDVLML